jgi:hypothetical protein
VTKQKTDQLFNALNSFSISVASEAKATDQAWPFVTISDWSPKARSLGELIGVPRASMAFCPVVNAADLGQWTSHTMEDALAIYQDAIDTEGFNMTVAELMGKTTPMIFYYDTEGGFNLVPSRETALPVWQSYPFAIDASSQRPYTNIDLLAFQQFSDLFYLTNATLNTTIGVSETLIEEGGGSSIPMVSSQIMQPIFKTTDTRAKDREMVGVVWLTMEWTKYFENFFTDETSGIILVLRNSCPRLNLDNQESVSEEEVIVVSYEINGPEATFLGDYDAHDPKYDSLEVTSILVDLDVDSSSIPGGQCIPVLSMHLYPTEQFEETFLTPKRFIYAGVVIAIFAFTSFVFLLYDYFVGRRQVRNFFAFTVLDVISCMSFLMQTASSSTTLLVNSEKSWIVSCCKINLWQMSFLQRSGIDFMMAWGNRGVQVAMSSILWTTTTRLTKSHVLRQWRIYSPIPPLSLLTLLALLRGHLPESLSKSLPCSKLSTQPLTE